MLTGGPGGGKSALMAELRAADPCAERWLLMPEAAPLKAAGFAAPGGAPGAWWRGLRLVSLDGTTLDAQDEEANWQRFGGPSTKTAEGKRLRGAFPQVRLVALAECGRWSPRCTARSVRVRRPWPGS